MFSANVTAFSANTTDPAGFAPGSIFNVEQGKGILVKDGLEDYSEVPVQLGRK